MLRQNKIFTGTIILTATGLLTRLIGFFYRIFLSHTFGDENVGLYQLIFPLYALCISLSSAGIEVAISQLVARHTSSKHKRIENYLYVGLIISLLQSTILSYVIIKNASTISNYILGDIRCEALLRLLAYAFPFSAAHACVSGFYIGLKEAKTPAISQLIEQIARVCSVYLLVITATSHHLIQINSAVIGLVVGEIASSFYCILHYRCRKTSASLNSEIFFPYARDILNTSIPLTINRVLINLLQSTEAVSIPIRLQQYGYSASKSLSMYGVLTGMTLPCILFPSAITNAAATMLIPTVAQMHSNHLIHPLKKLVRTVFFLGFTLGSVCCCFFLIFGHSIGILLFHSQLAGDFLVTLSWMCPFLYLNTTLISLINGLGKPNFSLGIHCVSIIIRIVAIIKFIPILGLKGYLHGLLISQLTMCFLCMLCIKYVMTESQTS